MEKEKLKYRKTNKRDLLRKILLGYLIPQQMFCFDLALVFLLFFIFLFYIFAISPFFIFVLFFSFFFFYSLLFVLAFHVRFWLFFYFLLWFLFSLELLLHYQIAPSILFLLKNSTVAIDPFSSIFAESKKQCKNSNKRKRTRKTESLTLLGKVITDNHHHCHHCYQDHHHYHHHYRHH